jgi:autotransporter family porin
VLIVAAVATALSVASAASIGRTGATAAARAVRVAPPTTAPAGTPTGDHFGTLPVGSALPSGADCAARVRKAAEVRPDNAAANSYRGNRGNANTRNDWPGFSRVDGDFSGSTDEIIQWAACKWGIDEDVARAQLVKESFWHQSAVGDNGESFGLGQVRTTAHQSAFQFSKVNARNSSAYNVDYTYATWRACFEGVYTWLNSVEHRGTYSAGDQWGCIGVWFSGRWYVGTDDYIAAVQQILAQRQWESANFRNG